MVKKKNGMIHKHVYAHTHACANVHTHTHTHTHTHKHIKSMSQIPQNVPNGKLGDLILAVYFL